VGKGDRMWRGPESGLPRGPCWLSAGLVILHLLSYHLAQKVLTVTRDVWNRIFFKFLFCFGSVFEKKLGSNEFGSVPFCSDIIVI